MTSPAQPVSPGITPQPLSQRMAVALLTSGLLAAVDSSSAPASKQHAGHRYLHRGVPAPVQGRRTKLGRNSPCPCGSSQKYKRCCAIKKGAGGSGATAPQ